MSPRLQIKASKLLSANERDWPSSVAKLAFAAALRRCRACPTMASETSAATTCPVGPTTKQGLCRCQSRTSCDVEDLHARRNTCPLRRNGKKCCDTCENAPSYSAPASLWYSSSFAITSPLRCIRIGSDHGPQNGRRQECARRSAQSWTRTERCRLLVCYNSDAAEFALLNEIDKSNVGLVKCVMSHGGSGLPRFLAQPLVHREPLLEYRPPFLGQVSD
jgi:hypothetical protein